jgi:hypothetical protein
MNTVIKATLYLTAFVLLGCHTPIAQTSDIEKDKTPKIWVSPLEELDDEQYPDNPDIGRSHSRINEVKLDSIRFQQVTDTTFSITMLTEKGNDSIVFPSLSLMEFIPTIQNRFKDKKYLSHITVVNQEWNRNQVRFNSQYFEQKGSSLESITRIDVARNCLNTYLWEVAAYADENGESKGYYHGWFSFPKKLFRELFEQKNHQNFDKYAASLEEWVDPSSQVIALDELREVISEQQVQYINHNQEEYLKIGERDKKYRNIIFPKNTTKIQDFLTDSTLFATFTPPGFYNTKDPRKTELSRLASVDQITARKVMTKSLSADTLLEIEVSFNLLDSATKTTLLVSGINPMEVPTLTAQESNKGWQSSMGFGNHTFYETYEHAQACKASSNPYFAYLTDGKDKWIDSHKVGIDGPLLYFDKENTKLLHVLVLSFERHAIVGHYSFELNFN